MSRKRGLAMGMICDLGWFMGSDRRGWGIIKDRDSGMNMVSDGRQV